MHISVLSRPRGLRHRVFLHLFLFTVVPLTIAGLLFFAVALRSVSKEVQQQTFGYLNQVASSLKSVFNSLEETSLDFIRDPYVRTTLSSPGGISTADTPLYQRRLLRELSYHAASDSNLGSIHLFDNKNDRLSTTNYFLPFDEIVANARNDAGRGSWDVILEGPAFTNGAQLSYTRLIRDYNEISNHLGVLVLNLSKAPLRALLTDGVPYPSTATYLVHQAGTIAAAGEDSLEGQPFEELREQLEGKFIRRLPMPEYPFVLVQVNSYAEAFAPVRLAAVYLVLSMTFLLSLCGVLAKLFSNRVIAPISHLTRLLKEVEANNYQISAPVYGDDELAELSMQFNAMVEQIRTLFHEVYVAEIHERNAELRALQSQISPHFIQNTLNGLYFNARLEGAPDTGALIKEFASLMRYAMQTERPVVTLREEIEHAESYLALQKHRLGERLNYHWQVDDSLLSSEVLRLILQPLLENTIVHGWETTESSLQVTVCVSRIGETIAYDVYDNGPGLSGSDRDEDGSYQGLGIANVNERLALHYGEPYMLRLENRPTAGTHARVIQPI